MKEATIEALESRSTWEPNTGCLLWMGATFSCGYGCVRVGGANGVVRGTHRVMYELAHGPIPAGHMVMHRCDQRACINPAHLTTGTAKDNSDDMWEKGRARPLVGEARPNAALTEEAVRGMRALPRPVPMAKRREIAKTYGVRLVTVEHALYGRTWRHLPMPSTVRAPRPRKTHCPKGHAYDDANTYYASNGSRTCRACNRAIKRAASRRTTS